MKTLAWVLLLLCTAATPLRAAELELDSSLNETVLMIPKQGLFTIKLETTLYKPEGAGPFPVVIINHGKAYGDPRFQDRYRPLSGVRYFLQRGYAVVVPMRQGFSKSEGSYIGGGCNIESNGEVQAGDVKAVLDYVTAQPWADREQMLMVGQSHGGWTTLAFGTLNYPGVKALVNFAGGLRQDQCTAWERGLAIAAGSYAKATRVPSLWFYGDNDSFFNTSTYQGMHAAYTGAGGQARLVAFGKFGSDSHSLFGARAGEKIWQGELTTFLKSVGLPGEAQSALAKYGKVSGMAVPEKTEFAALEDDSRIPFVRDSGRAGYKLYLNKPIPRAFAIAPNGAWGYANGDPDPLKRSLDACNRNGKAQCKLYSVDDFVVWKED